MPFADANGGEKDCQDCTSWRDTACAPIPVPIDDPYIPARSYGTGRPMCLPFTRYCVGVPVGLHVFLSVIAWWYLCVPAYHCSMPSSLCVPPCVFFYVCISLSFFLFSFLHACLCMNASICETCFVMENETALCYSLKFKHINPILLLFLLWWGLLFNLDFESSATK